MEIRLPFQCPSCGSHNTFMPVAGADAQPLVARIALQSVTEAARGNVVIGGPGVICRCFICKNCAHFSLYYDERATRGS